MYLTMLGTGHATVTECYNTCFALQGDGAYANTYFLVDGGGGNTILKQLKAAGIDWRQVRTIFVTHRHIDHLLGIIWLMRVICAAMSRGEYRETVTIYGHDELLSVIRDMAMELLQKKWVASINKQLLLESVHDGECKVILGKPVTFFDILSKKEKQYGFCLRLDEKNKLTCLGDEPYRENELPYARDSKWLLHEAFCLYAEADRFHPYEKHHSTVREACEAAQRLCVKNLLLYHTEDSHIRERKALYTAEGKRYYSGNLIVPDDLERICLSERT